MTRYEQETIIGLNEEEKTADIYTCSPKWIRKLEKAALKRPDLYVLIRKDECSVTYSCPKKLITLRIPVVISDEKREERRAAFIKRMGSKFTPKAQGDSREKID